MLMKDRCLQIFQLLAMLSSFFSLLQMLVNIFCFDNKNIGSSHNAHAQKL